MTFMQFLNVGTTLTPSATAGVTSKQVLLFGQRNTKGKLIQSKNGYPQPNYYVPFLLPSFSDGASALNYLKNYGIQSKMGIDFTLNLPAPTVVSQANNITTMIWATVPAGFSSLVGFNLSGTISQGDVSGTIYQATITDGVATLSVYKYVAFKAVTEASSSMVITGINNISYPDPEASDPIALMVWDFYQTALSAYSSPYGAPSAYISILSDRDSSISPNPQAIELTKPKDVVVNLDGSVTLVYDVLDDNLGYLPTTALGDSVVTQGSVSATYNGFTIVNGLVNINLIDTTGAFTTADDVSVILDNSVDYAGYLKYVNLYAMVQQFPVTKLEDITVKYSDFYTLCTLLNQDNQVLNNHYLTYGIAGNVSMLPNQAATLPAPNSQFNILVSYPYIAQFGDIPYENSSNNVAGGRVSCAVAYMLANGDAPFPPLMTATIGQLPVSSLSDTISYQETPNGTGDICVSRGWLPLAPNQSKVICFLQSNTSLITNPTTGVPDIEFRYTHIWDCMRWIKQQVGTLWGTSISIPGNKGSALMDPTLVSNFKGGVISILVQGEKLGIVQNIEKYQSLVTVVQDSQNPNQIDVYVPSQIIPQVNGANVSINIFSSLTTF